MTNPKLDAALDAASRGFRVFPISPGSKKPPKDFPWKERATTDAATIRGWWAEVPDYNIGIAAGHGLLVVDADTKDGKPGLDSLDMLDMLGLPAGLRVATPSGGVHVYLAAGSHRNRVGSVPGHPGIDIRSDGGYVLGPGSTIDGKPYRILVDAHAIDASPSWFDDLLRADAPEHMPKSEQPLVELDRPENMARAIDWLTNAAPEAVEGAGGDDATYRVAAKLRDLGLSEASVVELMLEHWNEDKASPPWQPDELARKVENAFRYASGGWGAATAAGEFGAIDIGDVGVAPTIEVGIPATKSDGILPLRTAASFAPLEKPERKFIVKDLIPDRNITILNGDGATGKSLLAMQLGVAMTSGTRWIGLPVAPGPVLYFSAEDDEDETHIRLKEICAGEGIDLATLGRLHIAVMAGHDCLLAAESASSASLKATPLLAKLRRTMASVRPRMLMLDNLADIFGGNENVKSLARQFIGILRGLALEFDCAVLLLAHPSLSGMASGSGSSGNVAWNNSVRSRLYLQRDKDSEGTEIDPNRRFLETKKANYAGIGTHIEMRWEAGRFVALDAPDMSELDGIEGAEPEDITAKAVRVFMEMVDRFNREGRPVSPSKGANYAPTLFAQHPFHCGVKKRLFEIAMDIVLGDGRAEVETVGPPSRQQKNIRIARVV